MSQTIKNFWAHRRQNAWIVVEIALVAVLSFYFLDTFIVTTYDTYCYRPAGDFEKNHLVVGQIGVTNNEKPFELPPDTAGLSPTERVFLQILASLYTLRDKVRALPEVQYAGLIDSYSNMLAMLV